LQYLANFRLALLRDARGRILKAEVYVDPVGSC